MSDKPQKSEDAPAKLSVTLPGKVEKIIPGVVPTMPDKAQITVEGADHLYKEIRVRKYSARREWQARILKTGAEVEVTIEAEKHATEPKKSSDSKSPADPHSKK